MSYMDTGLCVPESAATLAYQQAQLIAGKRNVQMFPVGTPELPLPSGLARLATERGVFHYLSNRIAPDTIQRLSAEGRENEFLNLGPIDKPDVAMRILAGESLLCVTETTPDGIEVRSAAGTDQTMAAQFEYFERTKEHGNAVTVRDMQPVISARLAELN